MTLGIIEGVLLMGMVGLIWVMLDIFAGDRHANDKQDSASKRHRCHTTCAQVNQINQINETNETKPDKPNLAVSARLSGDGSSSIDRFCRWAFALGLVLDRDGVDD
ncbi:MAG: hypothetical protein L0H94_02975 [Nitrospira sp.]|nr:hypothetical protein [Nitrospira sp.]